MGQAARLRVVHGGLEPRVAFETAPDVGAPPVDLRFAGNRRIRRPGVLIALALSAVVHGTLIAWGLMYLPDGEALAEGGSDELLVIEGLSVILLDGVESAASDGAEALPEAEPVTAFAAAAAVPEPEALAIVEPEAQVALDDSLPPAEPVAQATPIEPEQRPIADDARIVAEIDAAAAIASRDTATGAIVDLTPAESAVVARAAVAPDRPAAAIEDAAVRATEPDAAAVATPNDRPFASADTVAELELTSAAEIPAGGSIEPVSETAAVRAEPAHDIMPSAETMPQPPIAESTAAVSEDWQVATADIEPEPFQPPMPRLRPDVPIPAAKTPPPAPSKPAAKAQAQPKKPAATQSSAKAAPAAAQITGSVAEKAASGPQKGTAGAGGQSSDERGASTLSDYKTKLAARLRRFRSYPAAARAQQLTGTATVSFTVAASGAVTAASLAKGSGHAILDQAAVEMVRRASPFPPIPQSAGVSTLTVSVPVRFDAN